MLGSEVVRATLWHGGCADFPMCSDCATYAGLLDCVQVFIDADEFLVLTGPDKDIPALLRRMESFEAFGALVAHWVMFGSSNHTARPEGSVLQVCRVLSSFRHCCILDPACGFAAPCMSCRETLAADGACGGRAHGTVCDGRSSS